MGRGIECIITACKNDGFSTPEFHYGASGIWTTFESRKGLRPNPAQKRPGNDQKATIKSKKTLFLN